VLEKFARYVKVECPLVPNSEKIHRRLDTKCAIDCVDEDTFGLFVILGSTYRVNRPLRARQGYV
jgi:glutamate/tyrosine decarboxylase-like PLP-dependent enzyme